MKMKLLISLLLICTISLQADWSETLSGLTEKAKVIWDEQTKTLLQEEGIDENLSVRYKRLRKEHFNEIWVDVIGKLEKGLLISKEIKKAPDTSIFGEDKISLQKEFDLMLDDIVDLLLDDKLLKYRENIRISREQIALGEKDILTYREKKIVAPEESHIKTTRAEYEQKIIDTKVGIAREKAAISQNKITMSQNFKELGIDLTPEQIDVLLARVDGDDIIQMTLVMDVLKQITSQLLGIMQESNEELSHAKKYYGMHIVLLELVTHIQEKFMVKITHHYLPQIDQIIIHTQTILAQTDKKISNEENLKRRNIYYQNYQSQQLTLKTAHLYRQNLINELKQVKEANVISQENLDLSKNTYETVTLSSDLFRIIASSQEMMREVMKLQIPTIIPFENIQIRDKYQELIQKLQEL